MMYAGIALLVLLIAASILYTARRNRALDRDGIECSAVVSRIQEVEHTDSDGFGTSTDYIYYVTYRTADGREQEAKLGSGKSVDVKIGKNTWDRDLRVGLPVQIKYLPDKPDYVIRIG